MSEISASIKTKSCFAAVAAAALTVLVGCASTVALAAKPSVPIKVEMQLTQPDVETVLVVSTVTAFADVEQFKLTISQPAGVELTSGLAVVTGTLQNGKSLIWNTTYHVLDKTKMNNAMWQALAEGRVGGMRMAKKAVVKFPVAQAAGVIQNQPEKKRVRAGAVEFSGPQ